MTKVTDEVVDKVLTELENNKSLDGVLMYVEGGSFAVTDPKDAEFYVNMAASKIDHTRYVKALDILMTEVSASDAKLLNNMKEAFNIIMGDESRLTNVEPDTTTSQPVNPECGAG